MYKVFLQDKELRLVAYKAKHEHRQDTIICSNKVPDWPHLKSLVKMTDQGVLTISCRDVDKCWRSLKRKFKVLKAAGGLVVNKKAEYLMIKRLGRWDLPKGKLEKGEEILDGAIREVEEECQIFGLSATRTICTTYHVMRRNNNKFIKQTTWFHMVTDDTGPGKPQAEEGIEKVKWVKRKGLASKLDKSWPSILEVFEQSGIDVDK